MTAQRKLPAVPSSSRKPLKRRLRVVPPAARRTSWPIADLMTADLPPQAFAVKGIFTVGANLFAGPPKLGKSWLMQDAAYSVAVGRRFLDHEAEQGHVLYLALEGSQRHLQDRFKAIQRHSPLAHDMQIERGWPALDRGGMADLDTYLREHPTRLLVIDTLSRIAGRKGRDQYQDEHDRMSRLSELGHEHDCSVVAVLHDRQAAAKDWTHKVMGTNGYLGAADGISLLTVNPGKQADATLHVTGREFEPSEHALQLVRDYGWKRLAGPAVDYEISDTRKRILDYLRQHSEGATPKQVAADLDIDSDTVRQRLFHMVKQGHAAKSGDSYQALV
jgi:hypothetical protein